MPADPADPFATPASTQEEHDARVALVAELSAAQEVIDKLGPLLAPMRSMHAQTSRADEPCGWCRLMYAYDSLTKETSQ